MVAGEVLGVRLEQFYRLFKQLAVAGFGAVIVRAGKLAVELGRAFVLRQSLDSVDYLLILAVAVPVLAFFEQSHICVSLYTAVRM